MHPKDEELLNKPILNYSQMKTIFMFSNTPATSVYTPVILDRALNYLADHEEEHCKYAAMTEREKFLAAYLLPQSV